MASPLALVDERSTTGVFSGSVEPLSALSSEVMAFSNSASLLMAAQAAMAEQPACDETLSLAEATCSSSSTSTTTSTTVILGGQKARSLADAPSGRERARLVRANDVDGAEGLDGSERLAKLDDQREA